MMQAKPFTYRIPWKSSSVHFGGHRGLQRGLGFEYKNNVPLIDYPDARRMDLRQTLRDPYEQVQVKLFNQDNTTPIFVVCDLSSSMQYKGRQRKLDKAIEISASIASSAYEAGDVFSFIGYDRHVIEELLLPMSHNLHNSLEVIASLKHITKMQIGSEGILEVPEFLSQNKGLVFWISDFHMPLEVIEQTMIAMSKHQVIPVVLWEAQEYKKLPKFGFGTMIDPETGLNRTIFFRESVTAKFQEAFAERKEQLEKLFTGFESPALFIENEYTPEIMSHYFELYMNL
ncbi:MAG TPA: DUF58 domain-containing protein [Methylophilaceae bacterium]|jgi:uncharacterized protein (DUF58 family)